MQTKERVTKYFVNEALEEHGERLMSAFRNDIMRLKLINSQELINSLDFDTFTEKGNDGRLSVFFALHGRFQDMGAGVTAKIENTINNREATKRRKPRPWYTRNLYGSLGLLIDTLLYGLTEDAKQRIIGNLNNLDNKYGTK